MKTSIQNRLIFTVLMIQALIIGSLILYTTFSSREKAVHAAYQLAATAARDQAGAVQRSLERSLQITRTMAQTFSAVKNPDSILNLNRESAKVMLKNLLIDNPSFLSIYTIWEPDAFDLMDEAFSDRPGSDASGRFIPCWTRKGENIVLEPSRDYENHDKGDYYIIPRQTGKDSIVGPYSYKIDHQSRWIVSVLSPIQYENRFYGVVGVDIPIENFAGLIEERRLFNGAAQITLLSPNGLIIASTEHIQAIGKSLAAIQPDTFDQVQSIATRKQVVTEQGDALLAVSAVETGDAKAPWLVLMSVPRANIMAGALTETAKQLLIGILMALGAVLAISIFIRQHLSPLKQISEAARQVALGSLAVPDIRTRNDEIGKMHQSFLLMVASMRTINETIQAVTVGDFAAKIKLRSDFDELGLSINRMIDGVTRIVAQLNKIAEGSYSDRIRPFSDRDQLGTALYRMTESLKKMREINEKQNAFKSAQMELNNTMRGEQDTQSLTERVIAYMCRYLGAAIGAFFLFDPEAQTLKLCGTYAYRKRKRLVNGFRIGEGLVGQAALEKSIIHVTDLPASYVPVQSGLGQSVPKAVVVVPLLVEDDLKGVMELGAMKEFSSDDLAFLEQVAANIAIAIHSAQSRTRMKALLEKTQLQAAQLKNQQEALQQSNRELEEQTRALRFSEAKLQAQQEELRQANEELQEQTQLLEEQKEDIQKKNVELEMAGRLISEKAEALEKISRYKSEFLANMSHELRTPLNSILLLSKMMADNKKGNLTEKQVEFANTIHSSGSDLLKLINEVLDLSKVEAGKMELHIEAVPPAEMAQSIQRNFQHIAKTKGLAFDVTVEPDLPATIVTDRQRIEQILKNFLSNAFKFTATGGITVRLHRPRGMNLSQSGLDPEKAVAFSVTDTGIGIPKDKQEIVFEAFRQADGSTSRKYGGTGLGLSISLELAKFLGGEIQVVSAENQGSTFTLVLPEVCSKGDARSEGSFASAIPASTGGPASAGRAQPAPKPETPQTTLKTTTPAPAAENWPSGAGDTQGQPPGASVEDISDDRKEIQPSDRKMLIIEDDPHFARILCDLSHDRGFKVLVADNGETGLHFADYYKPDAIVLDVNLPGMDGWTVLERLKANARTRHIPVHIISANDRPLNALKMGAIGYMTKPISMDELDKVYTKIEKTIGDRLRHVLLVEDDPVQVQAVQALLGDEQIHIEVARSGKEAMGLLDRQGFDCMILDLGLPDISGIEMLSHVRSDANLKDMPIIVYTGRDLTPQESATVRDYAEMIVLKDARSPEKLLEETTLFLHLVESELPAEKKRMLQRIHDREAVFQGKKVLLVDDDMRNVYAITNILEEKGMRVVVGKNGKEGIERLKADPGIHLVLMDIMMPVMDGYEAMRRIRAMDVYKKLPIIALTAKAMKGDKALCIEAGANDYLAKPFDTDKLLSMLRVWLY
ncbi:response regulator [Desulfatirhabdium butyrativorans]|uniref:response regulator n=1 Tax=Desulfatirhabdium butyrativorans TaxID=340467 RepID=UPI000686B4AA|nr:response regulator [Desulfatirhabdium butyrativorans]